MSKMKTIMENWRGFTKTSVISEQMAAGQEEQMHQFYKDLRDIDVTIDIPLHVRGFKDFLLGRTKKWTEKDLTKEEIDALRAAAYAVGAHRTRRKKVVSYRHWRSLSRGKMGKSYKVFTKKQQKQRKRKGQTFVPLSQDTGVFEPEHFNSLSRFLGAATVRKKGTNLVFVDHYDFNDASEKNSIGALVDDIKSAFKDDSFSIARRFAPWRQSTGYKGFPVEITIPVKA